MSMLPLRTRPAQVVCAPWPPDIGGFLRVPSSKSLPDFLHSATAVPLPPLPPLPLLLLLLLLLLYVSSSIIRLGPLLPHCYICMRTSSMPIHCYETPLFRICIFVRQPPSLLRISTLLASVDKSCRDKPKDGDAESVAAIQNIPQAGKQALQHLGAPISDKLNTRHVRSQNEERQSLFGWCHFVPPRRTIIHIGMMFNWLDPYVGIIYMRTDIHQHVSKFKYEPL